MQKTLKLVFYIAGLSAVISVVDAFTGFFGTIPVIGDIVQVFGNTALEVLQFSMSAAIMTMLSRYK